MRDANCFSEPELKYAAQAALDWMKAALQNAELAEWIDPVTIQMLEIAVKNSAVEPLIPQDRGNPTTFGLLKPNVTITHYADADLSEIGE